MISVSGVGGERESYGASGSCYLVEPAMISTLVQLGERLFFDVKANNEVSQQDRALSCKE